MISPRLIWLIRRALPTHYRSIASSYTRLNRLSANMALWACSMGLRCIIWQFSSHILAIFANKTISPIELFIFRSNSITFGVLRRFPMRIVWQWWPQVASKGLLMGSGSPWSPVLMEYSLMGVSTRLPHHFTDSRPWCYKTGLQDPFRSIRTLVAFIPI